MDLTALLQGMTQGVSNPEQTTFMPSLPPVVPPAQPLVNAGVSPYVPPAMAPQVGPPPGLTVTHGPTFADRLPQLLSMLAGLGAAGNNPFGAAAYLRGFKESADDQAAREAHQQELAHRAMLEQQARKDKLDQEETARQHWVAQTTASLLEKAATFDTPEERAAFFRAMRAPMARAGINLDDVATMPLPGDSQRLQKEMATAATAGIKSLKGLGADVTDPSVFTRATVRVRGKDIPLDQAMKYGGLPIPTPGMAMSEKPQGTDFNQRYQLALKVAQAAKPVDPATGQPVPLSDAEKLALWDATKKKVGDESRRPLVVQAGGGSEITPKQRKIAEMVARGKEPPDLKSFYKDKGGIVAALDEMGFDRTQAMLEYQDVQNTIRTMDNAQFMKMKNNVGMVAHQMPQLRQAIDRWVKTGYATQYPGINGLASDAAIAGITNKAAQLAAINLRRVVHETIPEIANIYSGGNAATDKQLEQAAQIIQENWTPEALVEAADFIERNTGYRAAVLAHPQLSYGDNRYYKPKDGNAETAPRTFNHNGLEVTVGP